ncbi:hypothetical protein A2641_03900 [Candidatus Nomurabacteria bacterium RIFCSPHIGHO2_01_FULL_37_25]|uniref:Uncharacterized protein n=1 Tax=Candidatus Nomurabacteria bacterium RIFCSPLOWO2_01_FULL_36_16 TaxID=1801767 RepID=A0A1F6WY83_9BACT|nr:MAG: hypothetical protein A2641_03900 [Candidatus Nomurabacteria bacterium RIFCSPHIGHO2_01_FULL_37_25]OGI75175.1 MAG: hypothetical protein A3D36_01055 [Candidatus Nomurabacteria bacterium RIFCSPHIGHO2_02_FULL_36_29]OGI86830.1 MAG: hypothetical protein A3A91_01265 [Candidatus Nomurabacteria bacterium RIFCSPLOWO2_01_FULL_36_16]OGI94660.1 MAG: hypothetical protein A3I84_03210 [Candidatus Nomurabacteria bacterium RIFCSPLOWO2_02_FULL_36_8]
MSKVTLRVLASIFLFFSILFMPLWLSLVLAFASMAYFSFFLEAVFLFFLSDLLYGAPESYLFNIVFVSLSLMLICFIILELLKKKLRFHSK